jgi:hypothetical protein
MIGSTVILRNWIIPRKKSFLPLNMGGTILTDRFRPFGFKCHFRLCCLEFDTYTSRSLVTVIAFAPIQVIIDESVN